MSGKEAFAALNAALNGSATLLLIGALVMIKSGRVRAHATLMLTALSVSAVFLVSYLYSKFTYGEISTKTMPYVPPAVRYTYLAILVPHVILAIVMLPMIGIALWHAAHRRWEKHRRIAKPTWYIWTYVSVTGVIVYWMLYHYMPGFKPA